MSLTFKLKPAHAEALREYCARYDCDLSDVIRVGMLKEIGWGAKDEPSGSKK